MIRRFSYQSKEHVILGATGTPPSLIPSNHPPFRTIIANFDDRFEPTLRPWTTFQPYNELDPLVDAARSDGALEKRISR